MGSHLEELLGCLGKPGKLQILVFICLALNYFPLVFNHVVMAFFGSPPPHSCQAGVIFNDSVASSDCLNGSCPVIESIVNTKCNSKLIYSNNETKMIQCSAGNWQYSGYERETTIVTEWDLVCDDAYLSSLATTIYFCGVMVGGLLFGYLADKFGRRPIMLACLYIPVGIGVGIHFANSYILFVILRFLQGIFMQGLQTTSYILSMELIVPRHRPYIGAIIECFWGAAVMSLAGLAYFIRDWRYIQLAIALPSVLAVFYICFVPESIRWLIMKKKLDDAERLIKRYSKFNNVPMPSSTWSIIKDNIDNSSTDNSFTFTDLLRTKELRKRSLILFYCWTAVAVGYYGLTFKITSLAGNKYLNFFIGAVVEFIAYLLAIGVMRVFGRKKPMIFYGLAGAITCIVAGALPKGDNLEMLTTGFAIAGRFAIAGMFSVIFLFTSELYPTVIRNIGLGTCAFWARFGGVIAPQINSLGKYMSNSVPVIVFGVMTFIAAILVFFLPETHEIKLPDTIEDIENPALSENPKSEKYLPDKNMDTKL